MNKIFKLKKAIEANMAFDSKSRFITNSKLERWSTVGFEFLAGKAIEYGIQDEICLVFQIEDQRMKHLIKSYHELMNTVRYKNKSKLIDNYIRLN